jgi:CheY-like chemotaxis protein
MERIKRVVIIDDDPIFIFLLERMLTKIDFAEELVVYQESDLALQAIAENSEVHPTIPDVLFIDINMPVLDGFDFLTALRRLSLSQRIHIYMVSSTCDPRDLEKVESFAEISEFLMKPVNSETLQTIKKTVLTS